MEPTNHPDLTIDQAQGGLLKTFVEEHKLVDNQVLTPVNFVLDESQDSLRARLSALYDVELTPEQIIQATSTPASEWPQELRQKLNPRLLAWHYSSARTPQNYHEEVPPDEVVALWERTNDPRLALLR